MRCFLLALLAFSDLLTSSVTLAEDWPQFLGPQRNGISTETGLLAAWPANGVQERWQTAGGVGMSGIVIGRGKAVTMVQREGKQWMVALDAETGKQLWQTPLAPEYKNSMGDGPRATPTIVAEQIYVLTGDGVLACVALEDGKVQWSSSALADLRGKVVDYGMASSPLIVGENVIVNLGAPQAAVAAFDVKNGKLRWKLGDGLAGYSSPKLLNVGGREQVVSTTGEGAWGIDPAAGTLLWQYPFVTDFGCNTASPLAYKNQVFLSAGENHGSVLLDVLPKGAQLAVTEVWSSFGPKSVLRNEWQTSILVGEHLYGFDNVGGAGPITHLTCIEAATGKVLWQKPRFGKGNATWAEGKLFMTTLEGELAIGRISPTSYEELGRMPVVGKTRQAPALSDGMLFIRDDKDIVCLDVRK